MEIITYKPTGENIISINMFWVSPNFSALTGVVQDAAGDDAEEVKCETEETVTKLNLKILSIFLRFHFPFLAYFPL